MKGWSLSQVNKQNRQQFNMKNTRGANQKLAALLIVSILLQIKIIFFTFRLVIIWHWIYDKNHKASSGTEGTTFPHITGRLDGEDKRPSEWGEPKD